MDKIRGEAKIMSKPKFLPDKSGEYTVIYGDELNRIKEKIMFNKPKSKWIGSKEDAFYKKEIVAWYDMETCEKLKVTHI